MGKSSTLNSVLRPKPGEEPCTGGQGAPATSTVTRIHRRREGEGDPAATHHCKLRYLTPTQFGEPARALCKLLGFEPDEPDASLMARVESLLTREEAAPKDEVTASRGDRIEDYQYFHKLLRSYQKFSSLVTDPALEEPGDFQRRSDYTNHTKGQEPYRYLLLREVELGYRTEEISDKIELIDLPGLGARMASDDELTQAFLPNLDGALIFQSSEQVAAKEAYDLLMRLRELYPRLKGRVWMVITRFDAVAEQPRLRRDDVDPGQHREDDDRQQGPPDPGGPRRQRIPPPVARPRRDAPDPHGENYRLTLNLDVERRGPTGPAPALRPTRRAEGCLQGRPGRRRIERVRQIIGRTLADEVDGEVAMMSTPASGGSGAT